ncbi:MAG: THUMP domain-containing class I SAM-dependent RNA methyltransferase [Deferrisomatales bacterium]
MTRADLRAFAVSPPGFEDLVAAELRGLGLADAAAVAGGVEFSGAWPDVYRANLGSRVASRVLVRAGAFEAHTFGELERGLGRIDWAAWFPPAAPLDVRVAKHRTRLYHTGKVEEVVRRAVGCGPGGQGGEALRLQVRIDGDRVTVSVDTSGEHLHRRGYRTLAGPAPLRENLAAGLLLRAGYDGCEALLDPLCGSGTFAVEAALLALRVPPGRGRAFAFERLAGFDPRAWETVRAEGERRRLPRLPAPVFAADRDPAAVRLAAAAARAAGLADQVEVAVADVGELEAPAPAGLVVANPPYGLRLGGAGAALGALNGALRSELRSWRWAVVVPRGTRWGLAAGPAFPFRSGGLALELRRGGPANPEEQP